MADPNLRCQVAHAMVATVLLIPDCTCISNIANDTADTMLPLRPNWHRALCARVEHRGGNAGLGVEAEMNAAWQQREETRRPLRAEPTFERP